jgi:hypothetical protein
VLCTVVKTGKKVNTQGRTFVLKIWYETKNAMASAVLISSTQMGSCITMEDNHLAVD